MGFSVDETCIDCDLCRWLAPETFARDDRLGRSFVHRQPPPEDEPRALAALVACPTASIHARPKRDTKPAAHAFPLSLLELGRRGSYPREEALGLRPRGDPTPAIDGPVHFCGYASPDSYGAASWFVRRPDGNLLIDSPRRSEILMHRLEELGGVRWMFLTHRDDVADHRAYHERFGCERIIHAADRAAAPDAEITFEGTHALAPDLELIPTPGHTRGSACLLVAGTYLFTGDHLWADESGDALDAGRDVCWYSWPEQRKSVRLLAEHAFEWVLPGHGRRLHLPPDEMRAAVLRLAASM